jgi:hypothetical protein
MNSGGVTADAPGLARTKQQAAKKTAQDFFVRPV